MKSYLSLIPISAKVHRRQNRMTLLCIIFAVFMVTTVFSMAEMDLRMELTRLGEKHSNFSVQTLFASTMGRNMLVVAAVLAFLVLLASVMMISSSINSSVAQRTKFFGMMRCIGMSRPQIIRFVRLEALHWCRTAVPIGLVLGIAVCWGLCAVLRFFVGEEFSNIPLFGISVIGIVSGIVIGVVTVLLAASAPAKQAAKVSPVTAVSGNFDAKYRPVKTGGLKIETALGVHHAVSKKKNMILMTGSFALSIVLFFSFSVMIDLVDCLMPQSAAISDLDIRSGSESELVDAALAQSIREMTGVERVYGRRSSFDVPAELTGEAALSGAIDLISFDDFDLDCLKKDRALRRGSDLAKVYGDSKYVLATWDQESPWKIGDKILVGNEELEIAGLLNNDPFSADGLTGGKLTLITSGETFIRLTGEADYALLMVQTTADATDADVAAIRNAAESAGCTLSDEREYQTAGTYLAFIICVYSFLGIIALVAVLNIVNSISMSVSAKIRQYGAMRAVGMDECQVTKMISAEAFTYAISGGVIGCGVGLPVSKLLYDYLITGHFPYAVWRLPALSIALILAFVIFAAAVAAYAPAKRIRNITVTETINEL